MTPHVLKHLPLWIEGDLAGTESAAVESHLAECPACLEAAEALRASQARLREAMASPFDASDAVRLRCSVMDQIRAEPAPRPILHLASRPALLTASAAALLLASLVWRFERGRSVHSAPPPAPPPTSAALSAEPDPKPAPTESRSALRYETQARIRPASRHGTESLPSGMPARIEFQTADPTIRIIWLAQATPPSEPSSTPEEKS
ncbi:hypothetical protein GETHLI_25790 [Geothrix limicola]|uniref:Putative zinc-finger domain-containing protein n=1 Tax=Geothrix limicola TaxID=2927978 RepID=A0ABQ5QGU8_9BACT|nr:anti-sigma factor [Geothrix limicola]GLH74077.1 hypothetical protein GETHLI_25790 [Geothrix limicola]